MPRGTPHHSPNCEIVSTPDAHARPGHPYAQQHAVRANSPYAQPVRATRSSDPIATLLLLLLPHLSTLPRAICSLVYTRSQPHSRHALPAPAGRVQQ
jgi:hypothetical protein